MKILKKDKLAAAYYKVSPYVVAQARELLELANSNHPLAGAAKEAERRIWSEGMSMTEAYRVVKQARNEGGTKLLSAQIRAEIVDELHTYCCKNKQLFKDAIGEAIVLFLLANESVNQDRE